MLSRSPDRVVFLLVLLASFSVGCTPPVSQQTSGEQPLRLMTLNSLYRSVGAVRSEQEFKQAIQQKLPSDTLKQMLADAKVDSVDELFISDRDGQPYVIFYAGKRPRGVNSDVLAYEQIGAGGKRQVAYALGYVSEVDEQQFAELVPPASRPIK